MEKMNRVSFLVLIVFFTCSLTCCARKVVYVSSSTGNDVNFGESIDSPVKTINKALALGDSILLKRGDTFYENLYLKRKYLGAYGKGEKPILSGYKRIIKPKWESVKSNIWRICLADEYFSGFDTKGSSLLNNIGCIHDLSNDSIHGNRKQFLNELKENWDLWQTEKFKKEDVKASDYDTLYIYLQRNPNEMNLEVSVGVPAISMFKSHLNNIAVIGWGFGIAPRNNCSVKHCVIDAIGGMLAIGSFEFIPYCNGIEFWVSGENCNSIVEYNTISRYFDCGVTIQGRITSEDLCPKNIVFSE